MPESHNASPDMEPRPISRIIFVGFMGSGKTTVGYALAKKLGWTYYDLDWYIESRWHTTVTKLFEQQGEERFRQIEHNLLHEIAEFEHVIIGCGGGTPCHFDNMDYLNKQGLTIYLRATEEVLYHHLITARVQRPLWHNVSPDKQRETLHQLLQQREPFYLQAQHIVDISPTQELSDMSSTLNTITHIIEGTTAL